MSSAVTTALKEDNKLRVEDRAAHDWYRFVLSYPAHLVRDYLSRFRVDSSQTVFDPFCGTGTTLVECKKPGIEEDYSMPGIKPSEGAHSGFNLRCNSCGEDDNFVQVIRRELNRVNGRLVHRHLIKAEVDYYFCEECGETVEPVKVYR